MVLALRAGRFYGSGLPRPWFHADVMVNEERVDPPRPVLDPLLCWAREAHWSMGGLSFQRHRLQGRIEGSIKKLRAQKEKVTRSANGGKEKRLRRLTEEMKARKCKLIDESSADDEAREENAKEREDADISSIPSPRRLRQLRRRLVAVIERDNLDSDEGDVAKQDDVTTPDPPSRPRRTSARKHDDEFDRVASISLRKQIGRYDASPTTSSSLVFVQGNGADFQLSVFHPCTPGCSQVLVAF